MNPTISEISNAMETFYKGQIVDIIIFLAFVVLCCAISFLGIKFAKNIKFKYKVISYILIGIFAIVGLILSAVRFIPVYKDYTQQSYIIESDAEIFVWEQSSTNFFDNYDDIDLITPNGEKTPLKLYQSNSLSKNETYHGTFVYTVNSKTIIWYKLD